MGWGCKLNPLMGGAVDFTTEVLCGGIQSVTEGVGSTRKSASAVIQHYLRSHNGGGGGSGMKSHSSSTVNVGMNLSSRSAAHHHGNSKWKLGLRRQVSVNNNINEKLLKRLNKIDCTSRVISYHEHENEGLTQHAKQRVQRMMHYEVSLKPFVATVMKQSNQEQRKKQERKRQNKQRLYEEQQKQPCSIRDDLARAGIVDMANVSFADTFNDTAEEQEDDTDSIRSLCSVSTKDTPTSTSPFMCTPKSFPPTPSSRSLVMERGTRFAQDVIFLARDQLRVQNSLESSNHISRSIAQSLKDGKRLAVFNAQDAGNGIALSSGQHCATKMQGNVGLYCSIRCMIPLLRNVYVYFEMTVEGPGMGLGSYEAASPMASLSIGLSTLEMPVNTLVGAWKSSVGLCTTGQILAGGQWYAPPPPPPGNASLSNQSGNAGCGNNAYGNHSTVGCLVYIDETCAFETWDGVMIQANVIYNVDGRLVIPPVGLASTKNMVVSDNSQRKGNVQSAGLAVFVPKEEELYPTLTLHSPGTRVMCRFCAQDMVLARNRESIGAERGVTVYAVDGSVLFDENDGDVILSDTEVNMDENDEEEHDDVSSMGSSTVSLLGMSAMELGDI
eukprot:CAMPEP_0195526846 /NCGR_PEP_ID=MMETSP0794_2-20130614/28154_1 /TAXON_ID=515487 /ORGANISM="Stephanopyxis turris, Strain CCMP 815" /LENGTH=611 /DNA_ID=CAMNT_0040657631 /DNA_START=9 /DNA_END=1844 /DNA_ORIENTATION=-